jgi:hypothetical protein
MEINLKSDQLRCLDYCAQAGQSSLAGVSLAVDNHQVEYWLPIQLHPIADERLELYLTALTAQWQESIAAMAPMIAQFFADDNVKSEQHASCAVRPE